MRRKRGAKDRRMETGALLAGILYRCEGVLEGGIQLAVGAGDHSWSGGGRKRERLEGDGLQ